MLFLLMPAALDISLIVCVCVCVCDVCGYYYFNCDCCMVFIFYARYLAHLVNISEIMYRVVYSILV